MKYTASLFLTEKDLVEAFTKKVKASQEDGTVGKDFEGKVDGKVIKIWLPDEIKRQYRAVIEAESFLHSSISSSVDDAFNLRMKLWSLAKEHMLIDGKEASSLSDDDFTVDFIEQIIVLYLGELLYPLYHRSCTKAKALLTERLSQYISLSANV